MKSHEKIHIVRFWIFILAPKREKKEERKNLPLNYLAELVGVFCTRECGKKQGILKGEVSPPV
jgi:hypothetical protein